jgi:hypothetical protein
MSRCLTSLFILSIGCILAGLHAITLPAAWGEEEITAPGSAEASLPPGDQTPRPSGEQALPQALEQPGDVDFRFRPLAEALEELADRHGLTIIIDRRALDDAGVSADEAVTLSAQGLRLRSVLNLLLGHLELDWTIRHGCLVVTSAEVASGEVFPRVYDVADMLGPNGGINELIELITSTLAPESWAEVGGPSPIEEVPGGLVILQTWQMHERIADLLAAMRQAQASSPSVAPVGSPVPPRIVEALGQKVDWRFVDTPLTDLLGDVGHKHGIPVICDEGALEDAGMDPDTLPCTFSVAGLPLAAALDELLSPPQLAWLTKNDVLLVTTQEEAASTLEPVAFGVGDLYAKSGSFDHDTLIDVITSVDSHSWDEVGGPGSIEPFGDVLVVAQTRPILAKIETLLDDLRTLPNVAAASESTEVVLRIHGVQGVSAEQLAALLPAWIAPDSWTLKGGPGTIAGINALPRPEQPAADTPKTPAPGAKGSAASAAPAMDRSRRDGRLAQFGGGGMIPNFNCDGWLFIRQTLAVHRQIEKLLSEMGVRSATVGSGGNAGGFFSPE